MSDQPADPISAELERALFKRFWTWLAAVSAFVVVIIAGFSVIAFSIHHFLIPQLIGTQRSTPTLTYLSFM
jgi:hypothetical protein